MSATDDPFTRLLAGEPFVLLDGGLATELEAAGHDLGDPLWSARVLLEHPDAIERVHRRYFEAGADGATTATCQATFEGLARRGLDHDAVAALLRDATTLARRAGDAIRPDAFVAGSIGSYGAFLADGSEYRGDYMPGGGCRARRGPARVARRPRLGEFLMPR
jgi:homocysteine S-methyltransferase